MSTPSRKQERYAICVRNDGYAASLELCKIYRVMEDAQSDQLDHVRVIDESGEDYHYPSEYFVPITLPEAAEKVFGAAF
jgi:hypothetical protein